MWTLLPAYMRRVWNPFPPPLTDGGEEECALIKKGEEEKRTLSGVPPTPRPGLIPSSLQGKQRKAAPSRSAEKKTDSPIDSKKESFAVTKVSTESWITGQRKCAAYCQREQRFAIIAFFRFPMKKRDVEISTAVGGGGGDAKDQRNSGTAAKQEARRKGGRRRGRSRLSG